MHGDKGWQVVARASAEEDDARRPAITGREFSQTLLRHVLEHKQTFYQDLGMMKAQESLRSVDAVVVERLLDAGAVIVGKLNMDDFAFSGTSETSAFGCIGNPANPEYSAGGSSGGCGAWRKPQASRPRTTMSSDGPFRPGGASRYTPLLRRP